MPEQLDESQIEQIRQISGQLARKRGLSADQSEEIVGHLEDKLLGYLNGEVRITPADALLLARAHFGDAAGTAWQLAASNRAAGTQSRRQMKIRSTATRTGICTLVALPIAVVLHGQTLENLHSLLQAMLILMTGLGALELGVLLAARTDVRSPWQRAVAAGLLAPSLAVLSTILISGLSALSGNWSSPTRAGDGMILLIVFASLVGHGILFFLLAAPLRRRSEKSAPSAGPPFFRQAAV
jgi:hypothetical protein